MKTNDIPVVVSAEHRSDEGFPSHKGGVISWKSPRQRDLTALELGREILGIQNAVQLDCRGCGADTVIRIRVDVLRAYPNNERPVSVAPAEPTPAPAPSMPSASPPARKPNRERIEEIQKSLEKLQSLASEHAEYEDWKTAFVLSQTAVDLLQITIEELEV